MIFVLPSLIASLQTSTFSYDEAIISMILLVVISKVIMTRYHLYDLHILSHPKKHG